MIARSKFAKAFVSGVCLIVAFYVFLSAVLVEPFGVLRSRFDGLVDASTPFFEQRWSLFAPNMPMENSELLVQAEYREGGALVRTAWVNVTRIEFQAVAGHPLPSRVKKTSWNLQNRYMDGFQRLADVQKSLLTSDIEGDVRVELDATGGDDKLHENVALYDGLLLEYLTYFMSAYSSREVEALRWRVVSESIPERRNVIERSSLDTDVVTFGWRVAARVDDDLMLSAFEDLIQRYAER
ncbi:DUF5819 family protein [Georgenia daeguensis]|uniref:Uncharacterized protein n=1 Tax=Georgenia daeguensis TaxID=908355 RepID=A0ABP8ER59_9MICO